MTTFAAASKSFGFQLARRLTGDRATNVFISPLSAQLALAMAGVGARGPTERAILDTLGLNGVDAGEAAAQAAELSALLTSGSCGTVELANSLWARRGWQLDPGYLQTIASSFQGQAHTLDFGSPGAPDTINRWVADATHGKVSSIVPGRLPADALIYLLNATYFHGDWQTPFEPQATRPGPFHNSVGQAVQVALMTRTGRFDYGEGEGFQVIALPYAGTSLRMVVALPGEDQASAGLVSYLDAGRFDAMLAAVRSGRQGTLSLPRFHIDEDAQLRPALSTMGMDPAFEPGADFSGILRDCGQACQISEVRQKTHLDVDESGTTAAAVTQVAVSLAAVRADVHPPFRMVVDRPFLVAIQDTRSGALLFLGAIVNPTV